MFVGVEDGKFTNILTISSLSINLLSIYYITHSGVGNIVELSPNLILIKGLYIRELVIVRTIDHAS